MKRKIKWIECPKCDKGVIDHDKKRFDSPFGTFGSGKYICVSGTVLTGQHRCYVCNGYGKIAQKASKKKMPSNVVCY